MMHTFSIRFFLIQKRSKDCSTAHFIDSFLFYFSWHFCVCFSSNMWWSKQLNYLYESGAKSIYKMFVILFYFIRDRKSTSISNVQLKYQVDFLYTLRRKQNFLASNSYHKYLQMSSSIDIDIDGQMNGWGVWGVKK